MSVINFASRDGTGTTAAPTTWTTEFQRIYLMSSARIRGEPMGARHRPTTARPVLVRGR